jgi:hypothetical protein
MTERYLCIEGISKDHKKAAEFLKRAGEFEPAKGLFCIGHILYFGREGEDRDTGRSGHYWELSAMKYHSHVIHDLGCMESEDPREGHLNQSIQKLMIATRSGRRPYLYEVQGSFCSGYMSK